MHARLPLLGKRILITRAREQSSKLQGMLESAGAEVIAIPAIQIIPPDSYASLDAALMDIVSYDWLVLTSANAVHAMVERAAEIAVPLEALTSVYIAAIGAATADAITAVGLPVELIPPRAVAESLAEALAPRVRDKRVLLVRARIARDVLPASLAAAGASVSIAEAYQTVVPHTSKEELQQALQTRIDAVTFTSASSVHNLIALLEAAHVELAARTKKVSIGPITSEALKENGWSADAEADEATMHGLVAAVIKTVA